MNLFYFCIISPMLKRAKLIGENCAFTELCLWYWSSSCLLMINFGVAIFSVTVLFDTFEDCNQDEDSDFDDAERLLIPLFYVTIAPWAMLVGSCAIVISVVLAVIAIVLAVIALVLGLIIAVIAVGVGLVAAVIAVGIALAAGLGAVAAAALVLLAILWVAMLCPNV